MIICADTNMRALTDWRDDRSLATPHLSPMLAAAGWAGGAGDGKPVPELLGETRISGGNNLH